MWNARKFSNEWINKWIERCFIVLINFNGQLNSLMKEREKKVIFQYERVTKWKARQSVQAWYKYHYHRVKRNILMAFLCLKYVELNTKLQASFRRYNSAIPSYLRERPHHIIRHSMDRLSLAESIPSSNVTVIDMENGEFLVKSQSSLEEKMYKVMFGTKQPSCECFD